MKFCIKCGKTVSVLNDSASDLCTNCSDKKTEKAGDSKNSDLNSATFSTENGKLILKSKEGWLLWSGAANEIHSFHKITEKAERILNIRNKHRKK